LQQHASGNANGSPFIRSIFSWQDGLKLLGGTGAEAWQLFMPEPYTRKTRLTKAGQTGADAG